MNYISSFGKFWVNIKIVQKQIFVLVISFWFLNFDINDQTKVSEVG